MCAAARVVYAACCVHRLESCARLARLSLSLSFSRSGPPRAPPLSAISARRRAFHRGIVRVRGMPVALPPKRSLRHGRRQPALPVFGRILVHLSNVRTFHSALVSCTQLLVFALALVRLHPALRLNTNAPLLALAAAAPLLALAAACDYRRTAARVDAGARYVCPQVAPAGLFALAAAVAAVVLAVLGNAVNAADGN